MRDFGRESHMKTTMDTLPPRPNPDTEAPTYNPGMLLGRRERLLVFWRDHGGQIELGIVALWAALASVERFKMRKAKKTSTRY